MMSGRIFFLFSAAIFCTTVGGFYLLSNLIYFNFNLFPEINSPFFDYSMGLIAALICTILLITLPIINKTIIIIGWLVKIVVIFLFILLFEINYPIIDSLGYYHAIGGYLTGYALGTKNVILTLASLFNLMPMSYRLGVVFFAFTGFIGQYLCWRALTVINGRHEKKILYVLLFFPSLVFWSSFIGKEALLLFFVGIYMMGMVLLLDGKKILWPIVLIGISFLGFSLFRSWLMVLFSLSLTFSLIFGRTIKRKFIKTTVVLLSLALSLVMFMNYFAIGEISNVISWLQSIAQGWASGGSGQFLYFDSVLSLLIQYPWMMFTALFRPLIFEGQSLFMLFAGIENTILLFLFIIAIILMIHNWKNRSDSMLSSLIHVLCYAMMYGIVSYQNLGTAVRFKVFILPFMIGFIYFSISQHLNNKSLSSS